MGSRSRGPCGVVEGRRRGRELDRGKGARSGILRANLWFPEGISLCVSCPRVTVSPPDRCSSPWMTPRLRERWWRGVGLGGAVFFPGLLAGLVPSAAAGGSRLRFAESWPLRGGRGAGEGQGVGSGEGRGVGDLGSESSVSCRNRFLRFLSPCTRSAFRLDLSPARLLACGSGGGGVGDLGGRFSFPCRRSGLVPSAAPRGAVLGSRGRGPCGVGEGLGSERGGRGSCGRIFGFLKESVFAFPVPI